MRLVLPLWVMLVLSACTPIWQTRDALTPEQRWQVQQQELRALEDWSFRGRTIITQGREGWNANIRWQQRQEHYEIRLTGPFAQGGVLLAGDPEWVELTLSDGQTLSAETPEALLLDTLGWRLPVSALRDWLRGLPSAQLPIDQQELDEAGRLIYLEQRGWLVRFESYVPFAGLQVPNKVFIKHPDLSVRIVVDAWNRS